MKKYAIASLIASSLAIPSHGQVSSIKDVDAQYLDWHNKDLATDNIVGTSVNKAKNELLPNLTPKKTIVVCVIDGGVDIYHEDLQGQIWVNEDEIPGNGIDDDKNGFVDDIHGWNFIGNSSGENIMEENLEYTRIVKTGNTDNPDYARAKALYDEELKTRKVQKENIDNLEANLNRAKEIIKENTGLDVNNADDLKKVKTQDQNTLNAKAYFERRYSNGFTEATLERLKKSNSLYLDYYLNLDFDARLTIGDDPSNLEMRNYGNPEVKGPRSDHGTSVAGVIAAVNDNNIGINGIAENVKIMTVRSTPAGDERDKDVALAIRYAVNNGADIVNMSFGKSFSPQRNLVEDAIRYAEEHGVLLIHSAGNSAINIDNEPSFPTGSYIDGTFATNWLTVGASGSALDKNLPAVFSNYGANQVDLFAPGENLVSLRPENEYELTDGTSIASPVVTGIAAMILTYYPDLKPVEIIEILNESSYKVKKPKKVLEPNLKDSKRSKTKFDQICKSGGIVNAYNALLMAQQY